MPHPKDRALRWLISLALVVATAATYWRLGQLGFVNFDDPDYVVENPLIRAGLTWDGIVAAFTRFAASNWHPLTWLSHMLDCQLFGLNPAPQHLVNGLLHLLNSLLLFGWLSSVTKAIWRSAIVAALFALHPAHVESVAWISERKDVLSTAFGLLALWSYSRYATASQLNSPGIMFVPRDRRYWIALGCFALSLMSKPMLVTMPFLLLLLDWWPFQRLTASADRAEKISLAWRLFLEKWPWLGLSLLSCGLTLAAQHSGGAVAAADSLPLTARLANALISYVRYLGLLLWPNDLTALYPLPASWPLGLIFAAVVLLAVIAIGLPVLGRQRPYRAVGWFWFLGTLVPVIGLVQVGSQAIADRYTYFPSIGLFVLLVWSGGDVLERLRAPKWLMGGVTGFGLLICAVGAAQQLGFWTDSVTLFTRAVSVTTNNALAHNYLGYSLEETGRFAEAKPHFIEAVRLVPDNALYRKNLGVALARAGDTNAARTHLEFVIGREREIIQRQPDCAEAFNHIGIALATLGERADAIRHYAQAVQLAPSNGYYHNNLAVALARQGDLATAISHYETALQLKPDYAEAGNNLGVALVAQGRLDEALARIQAAVRAKPDFAEAQGNLGSVLARLRRDEEALGPYREALRLDSNLAGAHLNLGLSLLKLGRLEEAAREFEVATERDVNPLEAAYNLGRCRVLLGQFEVAAAVLTEVVKTAPNHASAHLGLGQAELGLQHPESGFAHLREAVRLRPDSAPTLSALAWALATTPDARFRSGAEALKLIEPVARSGASPSPEVLDALAAANAELGHYETAASVAAEAVRAAQARNNTLLAAEILVRQKLYETRQPFRSGAARN